MGMGMNGTAHIRLSAKTARKQNGTSFMLTKLNGYLSSRGNIPLRAAQFKQFLELLARQKLGTRRARYTFCRRRTKNGSSRWVPGPQRQPPLQLRGN